MRPLLFLFLLASSLPAQYFDFAVTDNGRLYFATSLTTGPENSRFKVYRLTNDRPELFASGSPDDNPFGSTASAPLVSGDGSITGWALTTPCSTGSCGLSGLPRTFYQLQGAGIETLTLTGLSISRNGRFLLGSTFDAHVQLIELPSLHSADLGQFFSIVGQQTIADNGTALMLDGQAPRLLYRPLDSDARPVPESEGAVSGVLSPAGDRIAFERLRDGRLELVLGDTVLASAPRAFRFQPRFANDGTLLYLDPDNQPAIVSPGAAPRRLATIPGGVQRSILSGDGRIAWLATASGQLLRVHTADSAIDEVIPATPYVSGINFFGYPGSALRFSGTGITRSTRFQIGDTALPVSALGDDVAYVQIPWEYPVAPVSRALTVQAPGSPFFERFDFTPLDRPTITFEREGQTVKAAHQDFRGLVSAADPARPGETLHVFARNMGPVDRPVATGQPSPDPPARVSTPMACYLFDATSEPPWRAVGMVVPFAGLSPGLVGIYHIDVTIPSDWTAKQSALQCQLDTGGNLFRGDLSRLDVDVDPR
jgi:uncharacterized protein (TIGR03437 family)